MRAIGTWATAAAMLFLISGCGGDEKPQADGQSGGKDAGTSAAKTDSGESPSTGAGRSTAAAGTRDGGPSAPAGIIDVSYVTEDFIGAIVVRPGAVLSSPLFSQLAQLPGAEIQKLLEGMQQHTGVDPVDIEQVMVLVDRETVMAASQAPFIGGPAFEEGGEAIEFERFDAAPERGIDGPGFGAPPGGDSEPHPDGSADRPSLDRAQPDDGDTGQAAANDLPRPLAEVALLAQPEPGGIGVAGGRKPNPADLIPTAIVRFKQDVDPQQLLKNMSGGRSVSFDSEGNVIKEERFEARLQTRQHAGKTYYVVDGPGLVAAHSPNDRTLILSREQPLQKILAAGGPVDSPLVNRLKSMNAGHDLMWRHANDARADAAVNRLKSMKAGHDLIVVLDFSTTREEVSQATQMAGAGVPPMLQGLVNFASSVNMVVVTADVTGPAETNLLTVTIKSDQPQQASQFGQMVGNFVGMGKQMYHGWRQNENQQAQVPPFAQPLLPLADDLVSSVTTTTSGDEFMLAVAKPKDLNRLPELLKPAIAAARERHERINRLGELKMLGIAMHVFHENFQRFPNADSGPELDVKGLSWRVHLAPFADEPVVYNRINQDEPWDSEHNRQFIEQMPELYFVSGDDANGKSRIHLFVGQGAPFGGESGPTIYAITDGPSSTIMAVQAGPETAVEWTKPGGLTFDPQNPKKALGSIPEDGLPVVFFDGRAVRLSRDIPDELLKALITHQGGEPINQDELDQYIVR